MKEEENWRIKYLKFFNSKSYRFPIGGAGYFQWAEFFCQMLVLFIIMIFIALKDIQFEETAWVLCFFDATIYDGHEVCSHNHVQENKN